jgi:hypothetical protein
MGDIFSLIPSSGRSAGQREGMPLRRRRRSKVACRIFFALKVAQQPIVHFKEVTRETHDAIKPLPAEPIRRGRGRKFGLFIEKRKVVGTSQDKIVSRGAVLQKGAQSGKGFDGITGFIGTEKEEGAHFNRGISEGRRSALA